MPRGADRSNYYVVADALGQRPNAWYWEIRRRDRPLGVRLYDEGFRSRLAAEFAGQRALEEFLQALAKQARKEAAIARDADLKRTG
jgi:hypothetical protein